MARRQLSRFELHIESMAYNEEGRAALCSAFLTGFQSAQRAAGLQANSPRFAVKVQLVYPMRGKQIYWNVGRRDGHWWRIPHELAERNPKGNPKWDDKWLSEHGALNKDGPVTKLRRKRGQACNLCAHSCGALEN